MRIASRDEDWESTITWLAPTPLEEFLERPGDSEASFYMILGAQGDQHRLFYLGMTFDQYPHWRLDQPDHRARIEEIRRMYPGVSILVSAGVLETGSRERYSRQLIGEIESLLIFVHQPEFNGNKRDWVDIRGWHYVTNKGHFAPLESVVYFGPAVGEEDE